MVLQPSDERHRSGSHGTPRKGTRLSSISLSCALPTPVVAAVWPGVRSGLAAGQARKTCENGRVVRSSCLWKKSGIGSRRQITCLCDTHTQLGRGDKNRKNSRAGQKK